MLVESAPGPRSAHLPHPRIATAVAAQPGVFRRQRSGQGFGFHPEPEKRTLLFDPILKQRFLSKSLKFHFGAAKTDTNTFCVRPRRISL